MSSQIFYFVPEDHDSVDQLNLFLIPGKPLSDARLHDIRMHFPVPGDYHFRFQFKHQGQPVCLDLSNDECALPQVEGGMVIVKATRRRWRTDPTIYEQKPLGEPVKASQTQNVPKKSQSQHEGMTGKNEGQKMVDDLLGGMTWNAGGSHSKPPP